VITTKKFEVLGYAGLCWPSLAFVAFVALDDFFKQKLAFVKLSTIRCQKQLPNKIGHFETLCITQDLFECVNTN
jgi:hypothetical protein